MNGINQNRRPFMVTNTKNDNPLTSAVVGFFMGCAVGMCMFGLGVFCFFIPIIGLLLGPAFCLAAMACPFVFPFMASGGSNGPCPQCGKDISMQGDACTCKYCKARVVRDGNNFVCY